MRQTGLENHLNPRVIEIVILFFREANSGAKDGLYRPVDLVRAIDIAAEKGICFPAFIPHRDVILRDQRTFLIKQGYLSHFFSYYLCLSLSPLCFSLSVCLSLFLSLSLSIFISPYHTLLFSYVYLARERAPSNQSRYGNSDKPFCVSFYASRKS